jgi:hypothetical protein
MGRNSNDQWTAEEDERFLKLRAEGKSNLAIAAALRRSLSSIRGRIYVLRKRTAGGAEALLSESKRSGWSVADEKRLIEMKSSGASLYEIASTLKRTGAAIENRVHVLKHRGAAQPKWE